MLAPACYCFYCCEEIKTSDIEEWTDKGHTAICPSCHIDSILPLVGIIDEGLVPESRDIAPVLKEMSAYWFKAGHATSFDDVKIKRCFECPFVERDDRGYNSIYLCHNPKREDTEEITGSVTRAGRNNTIDPHCPLRKAKLNITYSLFDRDYEENR